MGVFARNFTHQAIMKILQGTTKLGTVYHGAYWIRGDSVFYSLAVQRAGKTWKTIAYTFSWILAAQELECFADGNY